jgi:hypothetical protein
MNMRRVTRLIKTALAPRVLLVVSIAIAPPTLATVAHASPPDASWLEGIYDDADHDDVAIFLTSETGAVRAAPAEHPPIHPSAGRVAQPAKRVGPIVAVLPTRSRAPPSA